VAHLNAADQALVLRVVYDGPPEAGKTTSVRALAQSFGSGAWSPSERNGRTEYFDWLEHTAGNFDGAAIRCQAVSVPGQDVWSHRRDYLLDAADAIIIVGDTRSSAWEATLSHLQRVKERLTKGMPDARPVPAVFQANRRDAPDVVDIGVVRDAARLFGFAVFESVATNGSGIREAFTFAVGRALERLAAERASGTRLGLRDSQSGEALLEQLRGLDAPLGLEAPNASAEEDEANGVLATIALTPVSPRLPAGLVWPPLAGREILRKAMAGQRGSVVAVGQQLRADLSWGYRAVSELGATYRDVEQGRRVLLRLAATHARLERFLSKERCLALAPEASGSRLWHITRTQRSVCDLVLAGDSPHELADGLLGAVDAVLAAEQLCHANRIVLPCTPSTIGWTDDRQPLFIGDVPLETEAATCSLGEGELAQLFARELSLRAPNGLTAIQAELSSRLGSRALKTTRGEQIVERLCALLASSSENDGDGRCGNTMPGDCQC
jgi:signal recognition particle receptor subunit beta